MYLIAGYGMIKKSREWYGMYILYDGGKKKP
jgi:hypothetical protein